MIRLSRKLPRKIAVAVSGGCDSMAALDFLRRSHDVVALHYNHGTPFSDNAENIVYEYCKEHSVDCRRSKNLHEPPRGASLENFWREARYNFFENSRKGLSVVTCHHLDDVAERWLFTAMNGNPHLIPAFRDCYIRPFLQTRKEVFEGWCDRKKVPYIEDPSNMDTRFMRNFIRHEIMPRALMVNPGIYKVLRKKLRAVC